jgi:hypothetical protein
MLAINPAAVTAAGSLPPLLPRLGTLIRVLGFMFAGGTGC